MKLQHFLFFFSFVFLTLCFGQTKKHLIKPGDSLDKVAFINTVEQSLKLYLNEMSKKYSSTELAEKLNYESATIPTFSDEVYCERLEAFRLQPNNTFRIKKLGREKTIFY